MFSVEPMGVPAFPMEPVTSIIVEQYWWELHEALWDARDHDVLLHERVLLERVPVRDYRYTGYSPLLCTQTIVTSRMM